MKKFQTEAVEAKLKLEERKGIEKAKGILMKNKKITEEEAYQEIRKISMQKE